jgi:hypothetical protein
MILLVQGSKWRGNLSYSSQYIGGQLEYQSLLHEYTHTQKKTFKEAIKTDVHDTHLLEHHFK